MDFTDVTCTREAFIDKLRAVGKNYRYRYTLHTLLPKAIKAWNEHHPAPEDLIEPIQFVYCYDREHKDDPQIDWAAAPFNESGAKLRTCCLCERPVCSPASGCTTDCCSTCNPSKEMLREFRPCSFQCPRQNSIRNEQNVRIRGEYCQMCWSCSEMTVEEAEKASYFAHLAYMERACPAHTNLIQLFRVAANYGIAYQFRDLAYLGEDKLKYLVEYKKLLDKTSENFVRRLANEFSAEGVELVRFGQRDIVEALDDSFDEALVSVRYTPKIRPWKMLKILARLTIIFKRYQRAYYEPNTGKYLAKGNENFARNIKRQKSARQRLHNF